MKLLIIFTLLFSGFLNASVISEKNGNRKITVIKENNLYLITAHLKDEKYSFRLSKPPKRKVCAYSSMDITPGEIIFAPMYDKFGHGVNPKKFLLGLIAMPFYLPIGLIVGLPVGAIHLAEMGIIKAFYSSKFKVIKRRVFKKNKDIVLSKKTFNALVNTWLPFYKKAGGVVEEEYHGGCGRAYSFKSLQRN